MARERLFLSGLMRAAIFITMEIAALAMLAKSSSLQDIWLNRASHRIQATLWGGGESLRNYFLLYKQISDLAQENEKLNRELLKYRSLPVVQETVQETDSVEFRFIPAKVVKMSRNSAHNYIILDKGSEDGIKPNSGIVTSNGVVGFVNSVSKHHSYGITLMNSNASVSSRILGEGFTGPLVWDGKSSDRAFVKDLPMHFKNHPGDTVVTSGFSSIFPPDIPLGVTEDLSVADGATLKVGVTLLLNFSTIRYVTIVENTGKQEINALEAAEEDSHE